MEKLLKNAATLVVFLSTTFSATITCPQEKYDNWRPQSFSEIFRRPGIDSLIKGRAVRIFPAQYISHFGGEVTTATIEVQCVYRGSRMLERKSFINVTGFGNTNDCVNTLITLGDVYLIFLEPFSHGRYVHYAVQEYNLQRAVYAATTRKVETVSSVYECRTATNVTTTLAPWRSLTPIHQYPWLIPPEDMKSVKGTGPENAAARLAALPWQQIFLFILGMTVNLLSVWL